jgi:hypothetical protein
MNENLPTREDGSEGAEKMEKIGKLMKRLDNPVSDNHSVLKKAKELSPDILQWKGATERKLREALDELFDEEAVDELAGRMATYPTPANIGSLEADFRLTQHEGTTTPETNLIHNLVLGSRTIC